MTIEADHDALGFIGLNLNGYIGLWQKSKYRKIKDFLVDISFTALTCINTFNACSDRTSGTSKSKDKSVKEP